MIELAEAGGEFAAARAGGRYHYNGLGGLDIGVGAVPLVADDGVHISGVALGNVLEWVLLK